MILVRDVFQVKFGQAREAITAWKDGMALFQKLTGQPGDFRLLTDLIGSDFYTLVFESTHESLAAYEQLLPKLMAGNEWKTWYQKMTKLLVSGRREIFKIVE